jgi:hypothetical protein
MWRPRRSLRHLGKTSPKPGGAAHPSRWVMATVGGHPSGHRTTRRVLRVRGGARSRAVSSSDCPHRCPSRGRGPATEPLERSFARWRHVRVDPGSYVRRAMYHAQVSVWRRRCWMREVSVGRVPDRIDTRDDIRATDGRLVVRPALRRLRPRQRRSLSLGSMRTYPRSRPPHCSDGGCRTDRLRLDDRGVKGTETGGSDGREARKQGRP